MTRHQAKEPEQAFAALRAKEVEFMQVVEASREEMHAVEDQAFIAFSCILSLEGKQ